MTREELREKRNRTIETLDDIKAVLGLDELYIDELEKENAELKSDNDARKFAMAMSEKVEKQLRKENAELKRDKEDLIFIRNQNAKCMCEDKEILTKATEIIKRFSKIRKTPYLEGEDELFAKAEQFISEVEK